MTTVNDNGDLSRMKDELEKCRMMIRHAGNAIFGIDPESGRIVEANIKAEEMTGFTGAELTGLKIWELHPGAEKEQARVLFERVVSEGRGEECDMSFERKDGTVVKVEVNASIINFGGRRIIQRICRDITERTRLREELVLANEDLEHKVQERTRELREKQAQLVQSEKMAALGNLVAGVAHEINTPLGALHSNVDIFIRTFDKIRALVSDPSTPAEVRENPELLKLIDAVDEVNTVSRMATRRIVNIVNSLRNFARLEEAERKDADLHEGIESTLTLVHHQMKNRIDVVKNYGEIPHIRCYPNQLNQVFMNLLVNAAQAIEGTGTITVTTRRGESEGGVVVEISDDGRGIDPENLSKIFDPGFTTKGAGVGTGLGLSIVYQIVKDHDGEVEVVSQPGVGTTFRVVLPAGN